TRPTQSCGSSPETAEASTWTRPHWAGSCTCEGSSHAPPGTRHSRTSQPTCPHPSSYTSSGSTPPPRRHGEAPVVTARSTPPSGQSAVSRPEGHPEPGTWSVAVGGSTAVGSFASPRGLGQPL